MADVMMAESSSASLSRRQHLANTFEAYRAGLDADNERRERLIITSRLITQQSKKLIFHCHRGATSSPAAKAKTLSQGREKEREIYANFVKIKEELRGAADEIQAFWKWNRQVSAGLEEYIEGLSFLHYLEHGTLISLKEVQETLSEKETGESLVVVTPEDWLLGMSDLTGELMRYATNALSTGDHETPLAVCEFVRVVKTHFDSVPSWMLYKLSKKQEETTRSLEKIERVCYAIRLRLVEYGDRPEILKQMAKRALDSEDKGGAGGQDD